MTARPTGVPLTADNVADAETCVDAHGVRYMTLESGADLRAEVARLQPPTREKEVEVDGLAPCPFCRGRSVLIAGERLNDDEQYHWVRCVQCAAEGPWTKNRGGACRKWNAAAPPTREDVERAVNLFAGAAHQFSIGAATHETYVAARDALVALATRGRT